ncbi:MAG: glycosyltransferase family 2 protein [Clostridia bacterium]|nr:glycosyltransferase family 2 protein [Clostridia bacterium]
MAALFSIIVTAYNSGSTIQATLESIAKQTNDNYELVIVNDGSTDNTLDICNTFKKDHPNTRILTKENGGVATSRRKGVEIANGDYVLFVDSDDTINPDLIQELVNTTTKYHDIDIIRYQTNLIDDEEYKNHERYNFVDEPETIRSGLDTLKLWTGSTIKYALYWLFAFKRDLFSVIPLPDIRCYEDVAYIPLLITSAKEIVTISYRAYNYTCNRSDSLTNSSDDENHRLRAKDFYDACKFATESFAKLPGVTKEDVDFFNKDYDRRLKGFYQGIPDNLKSEFTSMYGIE